MKKLNLIIVLLVVFFMSCEKDKENVTIKDPVSGNNLNPLSATSFVLSRDNADEIFQEFSWNATDFGFPAVVTYTVQADKKSNNFSTPLDVVTVTNALKASVKVGDLNEILLGAELDPEVESDIQFRVKSEVNPNVPDVFSDVADVKITPYAVTFPPIFMTGAATGGWNWDLYVYKELRSSAPNVYETIGHFISGEAFRFFKQANWDPTSYNYPYFTGTVSNLFENANDGDSNFKFTGTTGYYKVTVDMNSKSVSMEAVDEPVLFMTGAALGGWDWTGNQVKLTWKSNGIFEATTEFALETFRFFKQEGWGDGYNYPYFADGTVSDCLKMQTMVT